MDPAQEIQACGRIHRLGQEQDCYIRRFAFKDSIEEAVIELHDNIKAGTVKVVDGQVDNTASREVLQAFQKDKVTHDHSGMQREREWSQKMRLHLAPLEEVHGEGADWTWASSTVVPPGEKNGRTRAVIWRDEEEAYEKNNAWQATCKQGACVCCGLFADLPGTYEWSGTGVCEYLNGDKRDAPKTPGNLAGKSRARRFYRIPRPPDGLRAGSLDSYRMKAPPSFSLLPPLQTARSLPGSILIGHTGWRGLALDQTDNGGELPAAVDSSAADSAAASAAADLAALEETSAAPDSGSAAPALEPIGTGSAGPSASHGTVDSSAGSAHGDSSSA